MTLLENLNEMRGYNRQTDNAAKKNSGKVNYIIAHC